MLISLNWLCDFVDVPADVDVARLAERFTMVCAEVEGVERIEVGAQGLIAARVVSHENLTGKQNLKRVALDLGSGRTAQSVTAAPVLRDGALVVYAPPGARTKATGELGTNPVAGHKSEGMILPGQAIGIALAVDEAIFCPPSMSPGDAIDSAMLDDWVIEVDNKSITHRPDLWGHYGIARELAAILETPLKPYPIVDQAALEDADLPVIPIEIDDSSRCPRYSGLLLAGLGAQAAPLWMQVRLGHVGMRPIDCLVDLSNYIMAELGQPMHAFDGDGIDRIEVGLAEAGSKFTTLDGVERTLGDDALMILNNRKPVALAGIMGGLETEVSSKTRTMLLESANFEAAQIRRCATALGLRTEASTRFEKTLDPANTVLAIQRFVKLAQSEFPQLKLASRLSDCYPDPASAVHIDIDPAFVNRFIGHDVSIEEITRILTAIEFGVEHNGDKLRVTVPSFRAAKDISIEADVIEEIARCTGYDNIEPVLPDVAVRCFEPNARHQLEQETLRAFCLGLGCSEVQAYIWADETWARKLGIDVTSRVELRNPPAAGLAYLRQTLMPGLLAAADRNRLYAEQFKLCEVGSVFPDASKKETGQKEAQERHLGLIYARRGKKTEDSLLAELKGAIETWAWQVLGVPASFVQAQRAGGYPWFHEHRIAGVSIADREVGTVGVVPLGLRRRIDEHLTAWSLAWTEIHLDALVGLGPDDTRLRRVPDFPETELDFSVLVDAKLIYQEASARLARFDHPLLRRMTFVTAYEGKSIPAGKRSLTFRTRIGTPDRTLVEKDLVGFRKDFEKHLSDCGFELRTG